MWGKSSMAVFKIISVHFVRYFEQNIQLNRYFTVFLCSYGFLICYEQFYLLRLLQQIWWDLCIDFKLVAYWLTVPIVSAICPFRMIWFLRIFSVLIECIDCSVPVNWWCSFYILNCSPRRTRELPAVCGSQHHTVGFTGQGHWAHTPHFAVRWCCQQLCGLDLWWNDRYHLLERSDQVRDWMCRRLRDSRLWWSSLCL